MNIIECKDLTHYYGDKKIYENLNFSVKRGRVVGLLGKNGVGKSTTINILMGFLKPKSGTCKIYSQDSTKLDVKTREKIGLLYEGHVCYDFLSIKQVERLHAAHYKNRWKKELYYDLISKLGVSENQKLHTLSCGQRSQVVLGLIFAQDPELLILDDYSIGLDTGYRRLFVEYLAEFVKDENKSVLMTTHIVSDLHHLVDDIIVLRKDKEPYCSSLDKFMSEFKGYATPKGINASNLKGYETELNLKNENHVFGFFDEDIENSRRLELSFEDAFLGLVGRY